MLLTMVRSGSRVKISSVDGGRRFQAHLASLGIIPGTEVEVISGNSHGPCIISVKGQRIILGNGMVHKIIVS